jgi:hypothetical protein
MGIDINIEKQKHQPSDKLNGLIEKANQSFGKAKGYVIQAYNQAIEEGFTPQEAKKLLFETPFLTN